MDFTHDPNEFVGYLASVKRDWTRASKNFLELVEHWQEVSKVHFENLVDVKRATEGNSIEGEVLGKLFSIELSPISQDKVGYAEAVLSTHKIGGARSEIGRFYIHRDGSILGTDGAALVDPQDNLFSYKIFTSIVRAVVEAPAAVRA